MHGLSVAGDVFTNPDFLSKLAPRSPDEQTRIGDEWNAIKKKDQEMLDELNKLRRSIQPGRADLTFADELSSNVGSSSNDSAGGGEPDQKAYENITNELSKSVDSLKAARKKLQTSIDNYAAKVKEDSFFGQLVKKAASIPTADVRQAEIKVPSTWGTQEPSTDSPESQEFTKALKEFDSAIQQCEALFTKHSSNPGLKKDLETGEEAIMRLKKNVEYGRAQHTALTSPTTPPRVP